MTRRTRASATGGDSFMVAQHKGRSIDSAVQIKIIQTENLLTASRRCGVDQTALVKEFYRFDFNHDAVGKMEDVGWLSFPEHREMLPWKA